MKTALLVLLFVPLLATASEPGAAAQIVRPEAPQESVPLRLPARTAPAEEAEIFSRATGVVGERRVDIGDRVKAGDILATIDAPEVTQRVARAQAAVAQAEARAELARLALQRAKAMSQNRVIAAETLDEREANAKIAEADLLAAKAELQRNQEEQNFLIIRAPFDGTVAARRIDRGDHIRGDQSQPGQGLFHLMRLDELRVELNAPPSAALRISAGQKATIEFPEMPGRSFDAVVSRLAGAIDRASGTMRVELILPNPEFALPAGLTGTATLHMEPAKNLVQVPNNAIVVREGKPHVAKVASGRVSFVPVVVGRNLGNKIEVVSGLTSADAVIVSPNALLREGDPVPGA